MSDPTTSDDHGNPEHSLGLSSHGVTILAETFRLLGDPSRLRILLYCLKSPRSVGDIAKSLDLSQTLVSHHLRLLRGARLVRSDAHVSTMLIDMASHIGEDHGDD